MRLARSLSVKSAAPAAAAVGVAAVVFPRVRVAGRQTVDPSRVLLIQRGRAPGLGMWCFPGGRLELGETMSACAARETAEETAVDVSIPRRAVAALGAHDVIDRDAAGAIRFHYCVVHVLGFADCEPGCLPAPKPGDDAMAAAWVSTGLPPPPELPASTSDSSSALTAGSPVERRDGGVVHLDDLFAAKAVIPEVRNVLDIARAWLEKGL